ncbi:hypothetical protein FKZ61_015560 [Litorilinea aerophila]|uniref:hypothetical protein n=1 Tax=Litorilinea aerophila TaxID=1204385 RepID=UPI001E61CDA6|nr:hypothetical protein [Litorilinea aerophila]MCC9077518.1 hypothetical protein [Litorilinea aerophila]
MEKNKRTSTAGQMKIDLETCSIQRFIWAQALRVAMKARAGPDDIVEPGSGCRPDMVTRQP